MHIDLTLAQTLERAIALSGKHCAEAAKKLRPDLPVASEEIAGGLAVFTGTDSPLSQAIGVGLSGPVSEPELQRLEAFFLDRGAPVMLELCPFLDASLLRLLSERPYRLAEFTNVLISDVSQATVSSDRSTVSVRAAAPDESRYFTTVVAHGYSEGEPVEESLLDVTEGFFHMPDSCSFIAFVDGEPAGGGTAVVQDGLGSLFGDSTLPKFRGRGVQKALIAARLRWLASRNCKLLSVITHPGTASQRNYERSGFRAIYTRTKVARSLGAVD